jgi:hypothetical protein
MWPVPQRLVLHGPPLPHQNNDDLWRDRNVKDTAGMSVYSKEYTSPTLF